MALSKRVAVSSGGSRSIFPTIQEKGLISWIENKKRQLLIATGITILLVSVSLFFVAYQNYRRAFALEELRLGVTELKNSNLEKAIEHLQKAENSLGFDKSGGKVAAFYLNEAYSRDKNIDSKKSDMIDSVRSPQFAQDYLSQIVLLSQGRISEKNNDFVSARKFYEDASSIEGPYTAEALLSAARTAELTSDQNAAVVFREKFVTAYPNSPFIDIVRGKLEKLHE